MKLLRQISIAQRLLALGGVVTVVTLGIVLALWQLVGEVRKVGVDAAGHSALDGKKGALKLAVDSMAAVTSEAIRGVSDEKEQLRILTKLVSAARYESDKSGYFFVYRGTVVVVMPPKPDLVGTDRRATVDRNGVAYIVELVRAAECTK
jgi:methyl-accepting chemotaxis protein